MTPAHSQLIRFISHSALNNLRDCERLYQIDRCSLTEPWTNADVAFGHAVNAGIQTLWRTEGDYQAAALACFFSWDASFTDEVQRSKKSICYALQAVKDYLPYYHLLSKDWKLAYFKGEPCIEFSLKIIFPDGFIYRAYADFILENKETEELAVNEVKTTGFNQQQEAQFKNSDQGTSYSLTVDHIKPGTSHFWVYYPVFYTQQRMWVIYPFAKTLLHKARWLKTTLMDIKHIKECEEEDYFPMRGNNCLQFGRPCKQFDVCQLPDKAILSSDALLEEKIREEKEKKYSFEIKIEQILENYLGEGQENEQEKGELK